LNWPIRKMEDGDRGYIIRSWTLSLRNQFPFSEMCPDAISKYSKRVEALIDTADVLVAHDPERHDLIYGFICFEVGKYLGVEAPTLHYVYTRKTFRNNGVASSLFNTAFNRGDKITYTHLTKAIHHANLKEKWNLAFFDPYYVEGALYSRARQFDAKAIYRDALKRHLPSPSIEQYSRAAATGDTDSW